MGWMWLGILMLCLTLQFEALYKHRVVWLGCSFNPYLLIAGGLLGQGIAIVFGVGK